MAKKWGHLKTIFATFGYRYLEVGNIFANISAKMKYFSKIFWGIAQGPKYYRFMQKTRHQKSHATVPLKGQSHEILDHLFTSWNFNLRQLMQLFWIGNFK